MVKSHSTNNKSVFEQHLEQAQAAVLSELPKGASVMVDGMSYDASALEAKLKGFSDTFDGVRETRAALQALLEKRDAARKDGAAFLAALKGPLTGIFGVNSPELQKFGYQPAKKRAQLTSEQLLVRAEKSKVTRAKRQTLGSRQKQSLRAMGDPVVTVTPAAVDLPPAPPEPAVSPSPAPSPAPVVVAPASTVPKPA